MVIFFCGWGGNLGCTKLTREEFDSGSKKILVPKKNGTEKKIFIKTVTTKKKVMHCFFSNGVNMSQHHLEAYFMTRRIAKAA